MLLLNIVSLLNKGGCLSVTYILPYPTICDSCPLSKSKNFPFDLNPKCSLHVLDIIHCDLWGIAPVISRDGYHCYVVFINDFSLFAWFYPL